jgi:hypothetical protein
MKWKQPNKFALVHMQIEEKAVADRALKYRQRDDGVAERRKKQSESNCTWTQMD